MKKVSIYWKLCCGIAFLTILFYGNMFAQIGGSAVKANFGIEADVYADTTQFHTPSNMVGTDDWFDRKANGFPGVGVIDTIGGGAFRAMILSGGAAANRTFVRRQAFPQSSVQNGKLLFDAVYARDNHSVGGSRDSSVFTSTKDKNTDNPKSWNLGTAGTPRKDDIVDVFAHLRRDGSTVNDSLWLLVGVSTMDADGNKHTDYGFFRNNVGFSGGVLTNLGPDSGHTAWKVVGPTLQPGDFILTVDFEGGGTIPIVGMFLWIKSGDQAAITAANPLIVFTGEYYGGGLNAGPFGYARITVPAGAAFAKVNTAGNTLAAPWGSLEGPSAAFQNNILTLQLAEAGINLSKLGLDPGAGIDPCVDLFGSVMFKSRASASFTSEMKDFVGPFPFGRVIKVTLSLNKTDLTCNGSNDGKITASWTGGIPPHSIRLDGGSYVAATSPYMFTNLTPGPHWVYVKDQLGCGDSMQITLTQPTEVTLSLTKVDLTCNGSNDGKITATFGGGTPPYQIQIDGGALAAATSPHVFTGLAAGSHTVRVVDSRDVFAGCEKSQSITLTEPPLVTLSLTKVDLTCNGSNDGKITATFGGGTPPYQIQIDGGALAAATSPHVFTGLAAGLHTVRVVDSRDVFAGCEKSQSITLTEPPLVTLSLTKVDLTCNGSNDGKITATFGGGTPPYQIQIDGGALAAATSPHVFTGLAAGLHTVRVVDSRDVYSGCEKTETITLIEPPLVTLSLTKVDLTCNGSNDGQITATFGGGTPPYQIQIDGGALTAATSPHVFTGLAAGSHTVRVVDSRDVFSGCEKTESVTLTEPPLVTLSLTKVDLTCNGSNDGKITATFGGGTPPYQIQIDGGALAAATSPHVFTGLAAGLHTVRVVDSRNVYAGCEKTETITLTEPALVTLSLTKVDLTCNGSNDGKITATFGGGTPPYQIQIDGGALAAATSPHVFTGLAAGLHTVRVVDSRDVFAGCEKTETITLNQPALVTLSLTKVDLTCNGSNDGKITATFGGGTPPYQIQIDGGALAAATSPHVFTGLAAGLHTVRVVDSRDVFAGCEKTETITLNQPTLVTLLLTKVDLTCNGSNDGKITATFGGGTPPYQIQIDGGALAAATSPHVFTGLAAGLHTVRVVDSRDVFAGCEKTETITLNQPALVTLLLTKVDLTCNGSNDGKITATFGGGTPPYQIQIDGGALAAATSPHVFTGLAAGLHTVRVVDSRDVFAGCEKTETITLNQPALVTLSLTKVDLTCNGSNDGKITATFGGGTPPYTLYLDGASQGQQTSPYAFTGLMAKKYIVKVVDSRDIFAGCEKTDSVTLTQPALVTLSLSKVDLTCYESDDGQITATFGGGTPPYTLYLDGVSHSQQTSPYVFTGLIAKTYVVRVVDSQDIFTGCEKTDSITLEQPPLPPCYITPPEGIICVGTTNPYTGPPGMANYAWSLTGAAAFPGGTTPTGPTANVIALGGGSYTVLLTVTDDNGCTNSCSMPGEPEICEEEYCTLTQGFYGNAGGLYCDGRTTLQLITDLLNMSPVFMIGKPSPYNSLTITADRANCVIMRLPAGGPAKKLPDGNYSFNGDCSFPGIPLKNGRFNNTLIGQTITLGLNLRLDSELGFLALTGPYMTTQKAYYGPDGICGTEDDTAVVYTDMTFYIPQAVLNTLGLNNTVADLFELANMGLGGMSTGVAGSAPLDSITQALGAINDGFDKCRFLVGFSPTPPMNGTVAKSSINIEIPTEYGLSQNYPNPFNPITMIEYALPEPSIVRLSIYNILGQEVTTLVNGEKEAGYHSIGWNSDNNAGGMISSGIYIYQLQANSTVSNREFVKVRKMILMK